jgi:hypothetical protein
MIQIGFEQLRGANDAGRVGQGLGHRDGDERKASSLEHCDVETTFRHDITLFRHGITLSRVGS